MKEKYLIVIGKDGLEFLSEEEARKEGFEFTEKDLVELGE